MAVDDASVLVVVDTDLSREDQGPWEVSAHSITCPAGLDGRRFRRVRSMARRRQDRSKDSWRQMWRNARLAQGVTLRYFSPRYVALAAQAQATLAERDSGPANA